jgi:hypothetical protein
VGYFTLVADQAFKTSPTGERLFYVGGRRSRPYIIPDAATEQRLRRKHRAIFWTAHGSPYAGELLLAVLRPGQLRRLYWSLIYPIVVVGIWYVVTRVAFAGDLREL